MATHRSHFALRGLRLATLLATSAGYGCGNPGSGSTDAAPPSCDVVSCLDASASDSAAARDAAPDAQVPADASWSDTTVSIDRFALDAPTPDTTGSIDAPTGADIVTSCRAQPDGTTLADGEICCNGQPIPVTTNRQCPALFHGSSTGVNNAPIIGGAVSPSGRGYWLASQNGGVFSFGDAPFHGSITSGGVNNIVGMAANPSGPGYWLVGSDGGIFAFGGAPFSGSLPGSHVAVNNIVGMAANPFGSGYWLTGSDGGIFAFGAAPFGGSLPGMHVTVNNIVGIAANPTGPGYWLASSDGGVFALGGAAFSGSLPASHVTVNNIVGITANPGGAGYWLVGSDGGVFNFGLGNYYASNALQYSSAPVRGMVASPRVYGYWMFAADGEVFVAPNAPPMSTATSPLGAGDAYLGQHGSRVITVWDANGLRNCNEGPFAQIPNDPTHVIGRYSNQCNNTSNWSLARWTVDWATLRVTLVNMIFDTRGGPVAITGGNRISTYYDATIASYAGELWVAGECGGTIAGAGTASGCIGPLSASSWSMDPARTNVAILGNQSLGNGSLFSASVPKLLVFQGGLYVYWSAVEINASNGQWVNITERGTRLAEFPVAGGLLWAARLGGALGAGDPTYSDEVWGLGADAATNRVADIGGIFTDGINVYANASLAGTGCSNPFWPPTCYALGFAKSANPLGRRIFNDGTTLPATSLPTNMGGELRVFTDPSGVNYLWGAYFTNVTGPRPLAFSGSPNVGYLLESPIPPATPFFGPL